jgi:PAS domain S-box-containing protein
MRSVTGLSKTQGLIQEVLPLNDSLNQLREFEATAMQLINGEKWDDASAILLGDEYVLAKKTYEVDSESAVSAIMGELALTAQRFDRLRNTALGLRIGALFLLLWVGVMFSRRSRADLANQTRLRDEISAAYAEMEVRVRERTADLEKTSARLAIENQEREKSEQRTRLILNSASEGIFGLDVAGLGVFFNAAALKLLGYDAEELIDHEVHRLIHYAHADGTPLPEEECPMYLACSQGLQKQISGEVLWRKDGSFFLSEYSVTPILGDQGKHDGAVVVLRDITLQRRNQQELHQRMDELQRFNRLTIGREERMIGLKQEINALLAAQGLPDKYRKIDEGATLTDAAPMPHEVQP